MPLPYFIQTQRPSPSLFKLADGRFQLVDGAEPTLFMPGFDYLVMSRVLAEYLQSLAIQRITMHPVTVFHRGTGKTWSDYFNVEVGQYFQQDQIHDLNLEGDRILVMGNGNFFASPALALKLAEHFPELRMIEGIGFFAA
ncbi:hypothetical protein KSF73_06600 [Burkholderiaceae bacterium DAT-1]|nr:hypothetical protein [Burkholderiaceae bacterium DAT-1]